MIPGVISAEMEYGAAMGAGNTRLVSCTDNNVIRQTYIDFNPSSNYSYSDSTLIGPAAKLLASLEGWWTFETTPDGYTIVTWTCKAYPHGEVSRVAASAFLSKFFLPTMQQCLDLIRTGCERSLPPRWISDSEEQMCYRCPAVFSLLNRHHHCRACGHNVCKTCSSTRRAVPRFGYDEPVRVCDGCKDELI